MEIFTDLDKLEELEDIEDVILGLQGFWVTPEMMIVTVSPPLENTNFTRSQDLAPELRQAIMRIVIPDEN